MTKDIQKAICKMLILKNYIYVCENIQPLGNWEYDVAALSPSNKLYEYEVKISRSDFFADAKKRNKSKCYNEPENFKDDTPNYFAYVVPTGLISEKEIPAYAGLYYYHGGLLTEVVAPKIMHKADHGTEKLKAKITRLLAQRTYIGMSLLTLKNKEIQEQYKKHEEERQRNLDLVLKRNHFNQTIED